MLVAEDLKIKLSEVKQQIPKNEWKFYSLLGIENFIHHIDSFDNKRYRDKAASDINAYLDLILQKQKETSSRREKIGELLPHFMKILRLYKTELDFIEKPNTVYLLLLLIGSYLLFQTGLTSVTAAVLSLALTFVYFLYGFWKMKLYKVY